MGRRRDLDQLKPSRRGPGLVFELARANSAVKSWRKANWDVLSDLEKGRMTYRFWRQVFDPEGTRKIAEQIGRSLLTEAP